MMTKDRCRIYDQRAGCRPRFCGLVFDHEGPHRFVEGQPIGQEMRDRLNGTIRVGTTYEEER